MISQGDTIYFPSAGDETLYYVLLVEGEYALSKKLKGGSGFRTDPVSSASLATAEMIKKTFEADLNAYKSAAKDYVSSYRELRSKVTSLINKKKVNLGDSIKETFTKVGLDREC